MRFVKEHLFGIILGIVAAEVLRMSGKKATG